ncbi:hypothetical protein CEV34_1358 [Brucella pseudogrignonensis]|uniref:Uncharacterized protein n=1 Tax=Brucella pseudogrignonensis TaxID=419475 RepID=A0A256GM48_9HYPH|nr:hypothetical protein CEV34_1358 [Brucella pseudogrignonensis]
MFRSDWIRSAFRAFVLTRILSENRFTLFGMRSIWRKSPQIASTGALLAQARSDC